MKYEAEADTTSENNSSDSPPGRLPAAVPVLKTEPDAAEFDAAKREPNDLLRQLADTVEHLGSVAPQPVVGVIHTAASKSPPLEQLKTAVVLGELRRRLSGIQVVACSAGTNPETLFDGEPIYPLFGDREASKPAPMATDCIVLAQSDAAPIDERLTKLEITSHRFGAAWWGEPYDSLVLVDRVLDREYVAQRGHYLRVVGTVPTSAGFLLACFDGENSASNEVAAAARNIGLELVLLPKVVAPTDLVAMVGAADVVVTERTPIAALASGLLRLRSSFPTTGRR